MYAAERQNAVSVSLVFPMKRPAQTWGQPVPPKGEVHGVFRLWDLVFAGVMQSSPNLTTQTSANSTPQIQACKKQPTKQKLMVFYFLQLIQNLT
jgi:hypothetical protein